MWDWVLAAEEESIPNCSGHLEHPEVRAEERTGALGVSCVTVPSPQQ